MLPQPLCIPAVCIGGCLSLWLWVQKMDWGQPVWYNRGRKYVFFRFTKKTKSQSTWLNIIYLPWRWGLQIFENVTRTLSSNILFNWWPFVTFFFYVPKFKIWNNITFEIQNTSLLELPKTTTCLPQLYNQHLNATTIRKIALDESPEFQDSKRHSSVLNCSEIRDSCKFVWRGHCKNVPTGFQNSRSSDVPTFRE